MLELLHFVDARQTDNPDMKLLPVFYEHFLPSDLSDQAIEDRWKAAWEKLIGTGPPPAAKRRSRKISLTVESCAKALHILRHVNGIKQDSRSFKLLQEDIVLKVLKYLPSGFDPQLDTDNVEGCRRLCDTISQMFQEYDKGTQCLGLYGMGGSGKTTMCKSLCRYFAPSFNHRTYHLQIGRNDSVKSQENLIERHKELLKKLVRLPPDHVQTILDPCKVLKEQLGRTPVFLAVDDVREDVDSCQEVRAYLSYLAPGSKMVITARSRKIVESVIGRPKYCKSIPNLKEEEALSLFLKIAAPQKNLTSLNTDEIGVLKKCLQICFFSLEEAGNESKEAGHYHPLALRAVASYFNDQFSKLGNIIQCGKIILQTRKKLLLSSDASKRTFDILGLGFNEICRVGKQLFIDVALYAPRADAAEAGEGDAVIFKWLVDIHVNLEPDAICMKLEHLRKMSFLHYEDTTPGHSPCVNITMHDLYREYAKRLLNEPQDEDSYKYGVYKDQNYPQPSPGWAKAPRIRLKRWKEIIKVQEWCAVSVIHLIHCETITTFTIGPQLLHLRELKVRECSKLENLMWTIEKQDMKLCFVELLSNESLKSLPDFSGCPELRELVVTECSSSVEPLSLHTCSSLQLVHIAGKNAPEVKRLTSCLKLTSVQLTWAASHTGLQVSNLPSLSELMIAGPSVLPTDSPNEFIVPHGHSLFCQHYPEEIACYKLGISDLPNLETLSLAFIPLGCLPEGLTKTRLKRLNLRGCLISQLMNFSEFPKLEYLSIAQTNVKKVCGLGRLKKLVKLDCRFNFRLQEVSDLRPCARLKYLSLHQCPELRAIPRLPPKYQPGSEDDHRKMLALAAFTNTSTNFIPPRLFALPCARMVSNAMLHHTVQCDGCMMVPLSGPRYKAKDIRTKYDLCKKCFTNKCRGDCNFTENNSSGRYSGVSIIDLNYDLCYACFRVSGCDESDFYLGIGETKGKIESM